MSVLRGWGGTRATPVIGDSSPGMPIVGASGASRMWRTGENQTTTIESDGAEEADRERGPQAPGLGDDPAGDRAEERQERRERPDRRVDPAEDAGRSTLAWTSDTSVIS